MFSAFRKLLPIKISAADSIAFSLALLHKNHEPTLSRSCKIQCFVNLCSLVDVLSSKTGRKNCKSEKQLENEKSCTVSFLIDSCGLSPEMAVSVSEKVRFDNSEKPNFVVTTLKDYGFSQKQIAVIVRKKPNILMSKKKTLLPKLEFFQSVGFPMARLATVIARDPTFFSRSLENQLIPSYNFLKSVLLTDERVAIAMQQSRRISQQNPTRNIAPNVAVLRELVVPESCIVLLLTHHPETLVEEIDEFKEAVKKVLGMGFDPLRSTFVLALHVVAEKTNRRIWDQCFETYRSWGWSKDDVYLAFRRHPNCMILSQNKISRTMDFLVNKMGWDSRIVLSCPAVLLFNLENRIIPRCYVIRVLSSRGLISKEVKLSVFLMPSETHFLEKFVTKHEEEVPQLCDVYKGRICLEDLGYLGHT
ncbi:transcription termination factor MTERF8, chloroplastic-like [Henckelia pumila]|uniref:transcription termination factor MTERF8, chloroplastic-like n=1 Tax=Henckelia pumila TaxID=405737 RepID=UPI003C6E10F5